MKYRYKFERAIPLKEVEQSLFLAGLAVEGIYGRTRVQLDANFNLDKKEGCCTIDGSTEIGCSIVRVFTGFLTCEFGEQAFQVERLAAMSDRDEGKSGRSDTGANLAP